MNINNTKSAMCVLFIALLLMSAVFVPAVSGAADSSIASAKEKEKGKIDDFPEIEVIEATDVSNIVQVGNVLISLKTNKENTDAEMHITDLSTDEVTTINYEVEEVNGEFKTSTYTSTSESTYHYN